MKVRISKAPGKYRIQMYDEETGRAKKEIWNNSRYDAENTARGIDPDYTFEKFK